MTKQDEILDKAKALIDFQNAKARKIYKPAVIIINVILAAAFVVFLTLQIIQNALAWEFFAIFGGFGFLSLVVLPLLMILDGIFIKRKKEAAYHIYLFGEEATAAVDLALGTHLSFVVNLKGGDTLKKRAEASKQICSALEAAGQFPVKILGKKALFWFDVEKLLSEGVAVSLEHREHSILELSEVVNVGIAAVKCYHCGSALEVDVSKDAGICGACGRAFVTKRTMESIERNFDERFVDKALLSAQDAVETQNWGEAVKIFGQVIKIAPNDPRGWIGYVRAETHNLTRPASEIYAKFLQKAALLLDGSQKREAINLLERFIGLRTQAKSEIKGVKKRA